MILLNQGDIMINTGYLFSKDPKRLFINTSLGCSANCSYCYLPTLKYSKGTNVSTYKSAEDILKDIKKFKEFIPGKEGTIISFGCYSECWDERNKTETIKLIKHFLNLGNHIQFATKKYVNYKDLIEISKLIQYPNQLSIFISSATISNWQTFESLTSSPEERFKSFEIIKHLNIPVILYIKPVIKNITIKDIQKYIDIIKKHHINDVVIGSLINSKGTGINAPFIDNNSLRYNAISDEERIKKSLLPYCNVYSRSLDFINKMG